MSVTPKLSVVLRELDTGRDLMNSVHMSDLSKPKYFAGHENIIIHNVTHFSQDTRDVLLQRAYEIATPPWPPDKVSPTT